MANGTYLGLLEGGLWQPNHDGAVVAGTIVRLESQRVGDEISYLR